MLPFATSSVAPVKRNFVQGGKDVLPFRWAWSSPSIRVEKDPVHGGQVLSQVEMRVRSDRMQAMIYGPGVWSIPSATIKVPFPSWPQSIPTVAAGIDQWNYSKSILKFVPCSWVKYLTGLVTESKQMKEERRTPWQIEIWVARNCGS